MRRRRNDIKSYVAPFEVGAPLDGGAVGEVVRSNADGIAVGAVVAHGYGWREYATVDVASPRHWQELNLRGFIVGNHNRRSPSSSAGCAPGNSPPGRPWPTPREAFLGLLRGENTGTMIVCR